MSCSHFYIGSSKHCHIDSINTDMRFYILLDTSGSMEGAKIAALNDAMANIVTELQQCANSSKKHIVLSILSFGREPKWMYEKSLSIQEFEWIKLTPKGMTPLGKTCLELHSRLISDMSTVNDDICIILLSDGCPTDDYDEGIETLQANEYFIKAYKYAIAIGNNADIPSLLRFTDDSSHIFQQNKTDELLNVLQNILYNEINAIQPLYSLTIEGDDEWE